MFSVDICFEGQCLDTAHIGFLVGGGGDFVIRGIVLVGLGGSREKKVSSLYIISVLFGNRVFRIMSPLVCLRLKNEL